MSTPRVLIVEDEPLVAMDLESIVLGVIEADIVVVGQFRARAKRWRLRSILPSSISKSRTEGHSRSRASFNETGQHSFSSRALGRRRFLPTSGAPHSSPSRSTDVRSNGSA